MSASLQVSIGQHSDKGRKDVNQDFHGAWVPDEPQSETKGVAIALADGISSSEVSQAASEAAVTGFLADYYCTPETWSVKKSAQRVLMATNSWLHAQTRQSRYGYDKNKGYVCTLSALVIKGGSAHLFHVGDSRIYRRSGRALEQLTEDHRLHVTRDSSYLSRALGINPYLEIDYRDLAVEAGDTFVLATDGVYEFASAPFIADTIEQHADQLDEAARTIVAEALRRGSQDNLTVQIIRVDALPATTAMDVSRQLDELPLPPPLEARMRLDGYHIIRQLHASPRSHVYLALDEESEIRVVLKTPSTENQEDRAYLERFLTEEWIARRINNAHVVKACPPARKRNYLYTVTEFIDGQTLSQWMRDNPHPDLARVRDIVEQIARGLLAFHRMEMLHQDLRPDNVMIDQDGTARIIDFGSARVPGIAEMGRGHDSGLLGTAQYTAPEYFLGEGGSTRSDVFSLAVITYQMLDGGLPYGTQVAKARTRAAQRKLKYHYLRNDEREIPAWVNEVLRKALHPDPRQRYEELSEFIFALRRPDPALLARSRPPLMERNPLLFWQCLSLVLTLIIVWLLVP